MSEPPALDEPRPADERVRLFVALELPDDVREALVGWRSSAIREQAGIRPIRSEDLHVTLCFLGWRGEEEVGAIVDACRIAGSCPAPALRLSDGTWLPPRRPRVLAMSLDNPDGALARVQSELARVLESGGWYRPEKRPFFGHVTVARVGKGGRVARTTLPPPPELSFTGRYVTVYRSRLYRAGARYDPLTRIELGSQSGA